LHSADFFACRYYATPPPMIFVHRRPPIAAAPLPTMLSFISRRRRHADLYRPPGRHHFRLPAVDVAAITPRFSRLPLTIYSRQAAAKRFFEDAATTLIRGAPRQAPCRHILKIIRLPPRMPARFRALRARYACQKADVSQRYGNTPPMPPLPPPIVFARQPPIFAFHITIGCLQPPRLRPLQLLFIRHTPLLPPPFDIFAPDVRYCHHFSPSAIRRDADYFRRAADVFSFRFTISPFRRHFSLNTPTFSSFAIEPPC